MYNSNNSGNTAVAGISPEYKLVIVVSNKETSTQKYTIKLSKIGKVKQVLTRAQASYETKNITTIFNVESKSFLYDALSESVTTFIIPIVL